MSRIDMNLLQDMSSRMGLAKLRFFLCRSDACRKAQSGAALGFPYDRLLARSFSIDVLAEHTFGDVDSTLYTVPITYRIDRWKFALAPGIQYGGGGTESL